MSYSEMGYLREQQNRALRAGRDLSMPIAIRQTFFSHRQRPDEVERRLWEEGAEEVLVDEEISGDGFWHVAAIMSVLLEEETIGRLVDKMESIGVDVNVRYDGWFVILTIAEERGING